LRAAHRRWTAWRVIECAGVATLWACALALPLISALWFRGEPAPGIVALVLVTGAAIGATWGVFRRPTLLETAIETDHQFALHDLLGTALTLSRCAYADDATRAAIDAAADERCRRLPVSRMVLNKLGVRAWAGIGLANALVLTLSLMTSDPTTSIAHSGDTGFRRTPRANPPSDNRASGASNRTIQTPLPQGSPTPPGDHVRSAEPDDTIADARRTPSRSGSSGEGPGDGTGSASRTDQTSFPAPESTATGRDSTTGTPAGGAGMAAASSDNATDNVTNGIARAAPVNAPPWRAATWDADRARALRDVARGAVPDRYRDLVRAYFNHDDAPEPR
jgi:hypothetical protein